MDEWIDLAFRVVSSLMGLGLAIFGAIEGEAGLVLFGLLAVMLSRLKGQASHG